MISSYVTKNRVNFCHRKLQNTYINLQQEYSDILKSHQTQGRISLDDKKANIGFSCNRNIHV